MKPGRYIRLSITTELLHALLDLPDDVRIIGAGNMDDYDHPAPWEPIQLWLEGDRFPVTAEGASPPEVTPTLTVDKQRDGIRMDHETLVVKEVDDG